jgi:murein DD-endopeptidase MepM/ murein hydrolase activator NlpD
VKLNALGMRASGWLPADPARYVIFGDPVYAPCSGVVVQSEDGAPDMPPPDADRTRMAGNHVLLDCGGVHVLVAHLRRGTVRVRPQLSIEAGTILGLVGNSGNSNEPHLHVHAQRPAPAGGEPLSGEPLPVTFDGRYLVRNDLVAPARR